LRLFGNVVAGEIIGAVMFALVPALLPLPLTLLGSITGVLQALVFTVLTLVFILDAIGEEEEQVVEP
jgi:F-type H+-transporting ATPase subunit a